MPTANPRNMRPPPSRWRYWVFYCLVMVAGTTVIVASLRDTRPLRTSDGSLFVIVGLLMMLELGPLFRGRWERQFTSTMASSLMFVFALLLHWGLTAAIIGQSLGLLVESGLNRKPLRRTAFNIAQNALTFGASYLALIAFGHHASLVSPGIIGLATLPALVAAAAVGFLVNSAVVGTANALRYHTSWWHEFTVGLGLEPLNNAAAIALAPLVVLAAERSPGLVPLLLIPLFAVHKSMVASVALKHQAGHDALTGLPNRTFLLGRAAEALAGVGVRGSVVGLFVIDLDRFKEVNDSLGHQVGDRLLRVVADRLLAVVRPGDVVARLGGDEFAILLPDLVNEGTARAVAERITTAIRAPLRLDAAMLTVNNSLGIALAPEHGVDFETLMQRANLAMYSARARNTPYETYAPALTLSQPTEVS